MRPPDIRIPFILFLVIIAILAFCRSAKAAPLTAEQRALVNGLTANNKALTEQVQKMAAQNEADSSVIVFANQKIESLTARLNQSKVDSEAQLQDLLLQAGKIKSLEQDRDYQAGRADNAEQIAKKKAAEAHRNAVERDICLFALSVAVTVLVMIYSGQIIGWITSKFPALTPYGIGLWIGLAILTFLSSFGASRGILAMIAARL